MRHLHPAHGPAAYSSAFMRAERKRKKERKKHTAQWSSEFLLCSPCHKGRLQAHLYHKRDSAAASPSAESE
jgi:hypothetical protein